MMIMMYNYEDYDHHNYDYDELLWCIKGHFYKDLPYYYLCYTWQWQ